MNSRKSFKGQDIEAAVRLLSNPSNKNAQIAEFLGCKERTVTNLRKKMAVTTEQNITHPAFDPPKRGKRPWSNT